MTPPPRTSPEGTVLTDPRFWALPEEERQDVFRDLRAHSPVVWQPEPATSWGPEGRGYWAVTRHRDVLAVSRAPELFTTVAGTTLVDTPPGAGRTLSWLLDMEGTEHRRHRAAISQPFSHAAVRGLSDTVGRTAERLVGEVASRGECDFAADLVGRLTLHTVCDMMDVPRPLRARLATLATIAIGLHGIPRAMVAIRKITELVSDLVRQRRRSPGDDLFSALVTATPAGCPMSEAEIGRAFSFLLTAGLEATRSAMTHGLLALHRHPAQREAWRHDFEALAPTAVEEILRWTTPARHFRRTAVADTHLGGQAVAAGDKVVLWYLSANNDEEVFDEPRVLDLARTPNRHVSLGAGGPHFCLGATLARLEITALFRAVLHRLPDLAPSGPPVCLETFPGSTITSLPCTFTPEGR